MFVIDASVALAWCLDDESSEYADRVLGQLGHEGAIAPAIWPLEVSNGLRSAERRGRLDMADVAHLRELLVSLPVHIEGLALSEALGEVADIARRLDLSSFDASYVALAARRGLALATADERLRRAIELGGVELMV